MIQTVSDYSTDVTLASTIPSTTWTSVSHTAAPTTPFVDPGQPTIQQGVLIQTRVSRTGAPLLYSDLNQQSASSFPITLDVFQVITNDTGSIMKAQDFNILITAIKLIEVTDQSVTRASQGDLAALLNNGIRTL